MSKNNMAKNRRVVTFEFDNTEDAVAFTDFLRDVASENNMRVVKVENPNKKNVDK